MANLAQNLNIFFHHEQSLIKLKKKFNISASIVFFSAYCLFLYIIFAIFFSSRSHLFLLHRKSLLLIDVNKIRDWHEVYYFCLYTKIFDWWKINFFEELFSIPNRIFLIKKKSYHPTKNIKNSFIYKTIKTDFLEQRKNNVFWSNFCIFSVASYIWG